MTVTALSYSFPNFELVSCSVSGSNCCFLTSIHVSQEAVMAVWYSMSLRIFQQHSPRSVCLFALSEINHFLPWASLVQLMCTAFTCVVAGLSSSLISEAVPYPLYEGTASDSVIPLWVGIWTVDVALAFRKTLPEHPCSRSLLPCARGSIEGPRRFSGPGGSADLAPALGSV